MIDNDICPECKHVLLWSVGTVRKPFLARLFRRRKYKYRPAKNWRCAAGEGSYWTIPPCGCLHESHNLERRIPVE